MRVRVSESDCLHVQHDRTFEHARIVCAIVIVRVYCLFYRALLQQRPMSVCVRKSKRSCGRVCLCKRVGDSDVSSTIAPLNMPELCGWVCTCVCVRERVCVNVSVCVCERERANSTCPARLHR